MNFATKERWNKTYSEFHQVKDNSSYCRENIKKVVKLMIVCTEGKKSILSIAMS